MSKLWPIQSDSSSLRDLHRSTSPTPRVPCLTFWSCSNKSRFGCRHRELKKLKWTISWLIHGEWITDTNHLREMYNSLTIILTMVIDTVMISILTKHSKKRQNRNACCNRGIMHWWLKLIVTDRNSSVLNVSLKKKRLCHVTTKRVQTR